MKISEHRKGNHGTYCMNYCWIHDASARIYIQRNGQHGRYFFNVIDCEHFSNLNRIRKLGHSFSSREVKDPPQVLERYRMLSVFH